MELRWEADGSEELGTRALDRGATLYAWTVDKREWYADYRMADGTMVAIPGTFRTRSAARRAVASHHAHVMANSA